MSGLIINTGEKKQNLAGELAFYRLLAGCRIFVENFESFCFWTSLE